MLPVILNDCAADVVANVLWVDTEREISSAHYRTRHGPSIKIVGPWTIALLRCSLWRDWIPNSFDFLELFLVFFRCVQKPVSLEGGRRYHVVDVAVLSWRCAHVAIAALVVHARTSILCRVTSCGAVHFATGKAVPSV